MADIRINKEQWESLSKDEQDAIISGLRQTGALKIGYRIVGDANVRAFDLNTQLQPLWNPIADVCKAICDTTAAAGVAWCTANTAGLALAACVALAESARKECRKNCGD